MKDKFTYEEGDLEIVKKPPAHSEKNLRRILKEGKELPPNPFVPPRPSPPFGWNDPFHINYLGEEYVRMISDQMDEWDKKYGKQK